jgi:asparagine synthase (glutamine-hydrolysing)
MCGIAGTIRFDDQPVERATLDRMMAHLLPRGPDGHDTRIIDHCGLVHTRLSILDLMGGHQPMSVPRTGDHGELWLTFNGEIYNHRALRRQLERLGHAFTSDHCDTEVLLHGYREWGTELPKHLHGMFAFAVYDTKHRSLYLCRDRIGKKPLHLYRDQRVLHFGSLIGSVLAACGTAPDIDRHALGHLLAFGYTNSQGLLRGISELPAGHWMLVEPGRQVRLEAYWQPPPVSKSITKLGAVEGATELITEAVHARLDADVPLGCFLSGGIDSSLIAAIAQKRLSADSQRLKTFSVAMPEAMYDEGPFARAVARHIGSEHHELIAHPTVTDDLHRLIATIGEPFGDSSILPTYWLSAATREHVSAALSGDGGDELFGGYDRYRALRMLDRHAWWLRLFPSAIGAGGDVRSRLSRVGRLIRAARLREAADRYMSMIRIFSPRHIGRLGMDVLPIDTPPEWTDEVNSAESARRWDLGHYLPFDLLRKVDRASMAVALEVRCPMLDTQVMDFASHVPLAVLAPGGRAKKLLREVAAPLLPRAIVERPKRGFAVPIGRWFRDDLRSALRNWLLGTDHLVDLGCRSAEVHRMIEQHSDGRTDHTHRLFVLLTLVMWRQWLADGARPARQP